MSHIKINCLLAIAAIVCVYNPLLAAEVSIQYKGLTLNADYQLAAGKNAGDGVVLMTHGALAHRDLESMAYIRQLLIGKGHNILAINLSLGLNNRHGMYDCSITHRHKNSDAIDEINQWLIWLQSKDVKDVSLLGHSRGAAQTALYSAVHKNPIVKRLVLMAPAVKENSSSQSYQQRFKLPLSALLQQARQHVAAKNTQGVLRHLGLMSCRDSSATAESFLSYYDQNPALDTAALLSKINLPTLIVVAGNDKVVIALDKKVAHLVDDESIKMVVIEGADHMFRDLNADDAVDYIDDFLQISNPMSTTLLTHKG